MPKKTASVAYDDGGKVKGLKVKGEGEMAPLLVLEERCKNYLIKSMKNISCEKDSYKERIDVSKVFEAKRVNFFSQFKLIFRRMVIQASRIPLAMLVLIINGILAGTLQASFFSNVANAEFSWRDA